MSSPENAQHGPTGKVHANHEETLFETGFTSLTDILKQQLELQREMMVKDLELQRERMNQQFESQQHFLESQLDILRIHLLHKDASLAGVAKTRQPQDLDEVDEKQQAKEPTLTQRIKDDTTAQANRKFWSRCCGLHTVEKWVLDYKNHPAGWAALLLIHGVPEMTQRLKMKVQNYAIFAALFLSGSIKAMSGRLPVCNDDTWECQVRKRVYAYCIGASMVVHVTCIVLAMAFHNALNEAARDSDVFRMFARGKGFRATRKCERAFSLGAILCMVGVTAVAQEPIGWDIVVWMVLLSITAFIFYRSTSKLLFSNASICNYWREELGGKPDDTDPYDLTVPISHFQKLLDAEKQGFQEILDGTFSETPPSRIMKFKFFPFLPDW